MKRDPRGEALARQEAKKVPGLQRKVKSLGDLAAKFQRERDTGRNVTSRLLLDNTRLRDALTGLVGDYWMSYAAMPPEWCDFENRDAVIEARAALAHPVQGVED